jgi:hypothetical protein
MPGRSIAHSWWAMSAIAAGFRADCWPASRERRRKNTDSRVESKKRCKPVLAIQCSDPSIVVHSRFPRVRWSRSRWITYGSIHLLRAKPAGAGVLARIGLARPDPRNDNRPTDPDPSRPGTGAPHGPAARRAPLSRRVPHPSGRRTARRPAETETLRETRWVSLEAPSGGKTRVARRSMRGSPRALRRARGATGPPPSWRRPTPPRAMWPPAVSASSRTRPASTVTRPPCPASFGGASPASSAAAGPPPNRVGHWPDPG